jgi:hypothetical protein
MTHDHKLVSAIETVTDNQLKAELLHKCLDTINKHQEEVNATLREEINSRIKTNESTVAHAIATDKARNELFNNRSLIIFAWCFPVAAGFAASPYTQLTPPLAH